MDAEPKHLFVYGTLRGDPRHDMYHVLARSAAFAGDGSVNARLYDLGEYPGIVLSPSNDDVVIGEVYELDPDNTSEVLRVLDDYEGLGPSDPAPHEYLRTVVQVHLADGLIVPAWAYVLSQADPPHPRIPVSDYLKWKDQRSVQPGPR